jgi:steroid delta-isomerase-like uncharacterized protein
MAGQASDRGCRSWLVPPLTLNRLGLGVVEDAQEVEDEVHTKHADTRTTALKKEEIASVSNKQIARRWFEEVWNNRDAKAISRMFAKEGVAHGLGADGEDLIGPDGFLPFHTAFLTSFADLQITIDDLIEAEDRVAVRWRARGTHTGGGLGLAPTGKPMSITGMSILRVQNGQIVEAWNNFDVLGMHQQLGTLSPFAAR